MGMDQAALLIKQSMTALRSSRSGSGRLVGLYRWDEGGLRFRELGRHGLLPACYQATVGLHAALAATTAQNRLSATRLCSSRRR